MMKQVRADAVKKCDPVTKSECEQAPVTRQKYLQLTYTPTLVGAFVRRIRRVRDRKNIHSIVEMLGGE